MIIGIDLMSGDGAFEDKFKSILALASSHYPNETFVLYSTLDCQITLKQRFESQLPFFPQIVFELCSSYIGMEEEPIEAVKIKENSTLVRGVKDLAGKRLDAFVSAGNTGALVLAAYHHLPRLPYIERPALLVNVPTKKNTLSVLDVGGHTSLRAKHLVQYALMGAAYQKALGCILPKVALLNIGTEAYKGQIQHRQAYELLEKISKQPSLSSLLSLKSAWFNFQGNIEGRDVFNGDIDVLVTDGFSGNIFLKTAEGMVCFLLSLIDEKARDKKAFLEGWITISSEVRQALDYEEFTGALVAGVDALLIKCHGASSEKAIVRAVQGAYDLSHSSFLDLVRSSLEEAPRYSL